MCGRLRGRLFKDLPGAQGYLYKGTSPKTVLASGATVSRAGDHIREEVLGTGGPSAYTKESRGGPVPRGTREETKIMVQIIEVTGEVSRSECARGRAA